MFSTYIRIFSMKPIIYFPATKTDFLTAVISRSNVLFFSIAILTKLLYFMHYGHLLVIGIIYAII